MQNIIKLKEVQIPEKNPNQPNDIYKKDGTKGAVLSLVGLLVMSIVCTIVCSVFFGSNIYNVVVFGFRESADYWGWIAFGFCVYVSILWVKVNVRDLYKAYGYRKKICSKGTAYPGVVTQVAEYTKRGGATMYGSLKWEKYGMEIKYADTSLWVSGIEADPRKCLENLYCTVYVWNGKAIATDFKLKEAYISKNGKRYLSIPNKM